MQRQKVIARLVVMLVFIIILSASPVLSLLQTTAVIQNTGMIQVGTNIMAQSGSAADIQTAVDWVVSHGGIGNVSIPAGTFNFVNSGASWKTVNVPAGVNIIGAEPSGSDSLGIPTSWATVLVMPIEGTGDINSGPSWFSVSGNSNPNKPTRIANLKLVGYRSTHPTSVTMQRGITITSVINFRVDHCSFEHTTLSAVLVWGDYCCGVIDHNRIYNIYAYDDLAQFTNSNVNYGVEMHRGYGTTYWEPTSAVLGQYTQYTVFIENNYFSKWRHCVSSGHGSYYVFRYNLIDQDLGHYSLDVHGLRDSETGRAGGRGAEIYENTFQNLSDTSLRNIFQDGGGCGVFFNNYIDSSYRSTGISLYTEDYIASPTWHLQDFYLWSSKGISLNDPTTAFAANRNVKAYWSRQAGNPGDANYPNVDPTWSIAGYTPYAYPHPLTLT